MRTVHSNRSVAALGGIALLGLAFAGTAVYRHGRSSSAGNERATSGSSPQGVLANIPPRPQPTTTLPVTEASKDACLFHKGETRAWALESTLTAKLDAQGLGVGLGSFAAAAAASAQGTTSTTKAILQVEALSDSTDDGSTLLGVLDEVTPETEARVGKLNRPFLLRVGTDCALAGYAREASAAILAARTQQALVYELSFVVPREASTPFVGRDGVGTYLANIGTGSDGAGEFVRRRRLSYQELWQKVSPTASTREIDASALTVRRDAGLWFQSMAGDEVVSGAGVTRAETKLAVGPTPSRPERLARAARTEAAYIWEDLLPREVHLLSSAKLTAAEAAERDRLKSVPLEEAFGRFEAQVASHKNVNEQWQQLSKYLEARPEMIPRLRTSLRNNVLPPAERAGAFLALGMARVPEARDALEKINRDAGTTWLNRGQSALLLANRDDVDVSLAKQFRADATRALGDGTPAELEYARTAALALGVMAGVHKDSMPGVADVTRGMIANALSSAKTADRLSPAFGAMGNLGDVGSIPQIAQWSQNAKAEIRAVVPRAMRRMPFEQIHALSVDWLARETSPGVKRELYGVLRGIAVDQHVEVPADLAAIAAKDLIAQPDITTRQSIVRLLGPSAKTNPTVEEALLYQARLEVGKRTGLYNTIAQYVSGPELVEVIAEAEAASNAGGVQ